MLIKVGTVLEQYHTQFVVIGRVRRCGHFAFMYMRKTDFDRRDFEPTKIYGMYYSLIHCFKERGKLSKDDLEDLKYYTAKLKIVDAPLMYTYDIDFRELENFHLLILQNYKVNKEEILKKKPIDILVTNGDNFIGLKSQAEDVYDFSYCKEHPEEYLYVVY